MERITDRLPDGTAYVRSETGEEGTGAFTTQRRLPEIISKLAAYEDTGWTPEEMEEAKKTIHEAACTMDKIVQMITEGRAIILPCAIGSTVYVISHKYRAGRDEWWINTGKFRPSDLENIGTRVFLTPEDAERAIEERRAGRA